MLLGLVLVSHFLFLRSSLFAVLCPCPVSLVFFIDLCLLVFSFEFVAPSQYLSILCIVWFCVYYYIDILVLTPHFVSRRLLSSLLSLYRDLYLITWLLTCLFDYDFGFVQLNHYFHYIVHLGPHSLSLSLTTRNSSHLYPGELLNLQSFQLHCRPPWECRRHPPISWATE